MKIRITTILFFFLMYNMAFSQKSLKLKKHKNTFIYGQLNVHAGCAEKNDKVNWGLAGSSSPTQLALQVLSKNRKLLLKGYTPKMSLQATKIQFTLSYSPEHYNQNDKATFVKLQMVDAWLKFATKWDRTSLKVGYFAFPYGHNPKIDPISSFTTNITGIDLGFSRDVGILFKTPLNRYFDIEIAATTGGWFNNTITSYEHYQPQDSPNYSDFEMSDYSYKNSWLLSGRIGRPTFNKHEFGGILVAGHISDLIVDGDKSHIARIGGDWVFKDKEVLKTSHQLTVGLSYSDIAGKHQGLYIQNNVDLFLNKHFITSFSHASKFLKHTTNGHRYRESVFTGSLTFAVTPLIRFRLNEYYKYNSAEENGCWGVLLQLVVGLGQKG